MNDQTRIELIETLINTLNIYREKTDKLSIEQALTGHLQNEISHLMTENEFINWIDTGEFKPQTILVGEFILERSNQLWVIIN